MPVRAVNDEDQRQQTGAYWSRPRWSAPKTVEAVLRPLERGVAGGAVLLIAVPSPTPKR
jgi:hypothetical protein